MFQYVLQKHCCFGMIFKDVNEHNQGRDVSIKNDYHMSHVCLEFIFCLLIF
jgi:hypothetical protein